MVLVEITWAKGFTRWTDVPKATEPVYDGPGFYAVLISQFDKTDKMWKRFKLLYIGQAYDQKLRERIPQEHKAYACVQKWLEANAGYEAVVMVGKITKSGSGVTADLMNCVECCLIFTNKPDCNTTCKDAYEWKLSLEIINKGDFSPLKETSKCQP